MAPPRSKLLPRMKMPISASKMPSFIPKSPKSLFRVSGRDFHIPLPTASYFPLLNLLVKGPCALVPSVCRIFKMYKTRIGNQRSSIQKSRDIQPKSDALHGGFFYDHPVTAAAFTPSSLNSIPAFCLTSENKEALPPAHKFQGVAAGANTSSTPSLSRAWFKAGILEKYLNWKTEKSISWVDLSAGSNAEIKTSGQGGCKHPRPYREECMWQRHCFQNSLPPHHNQRSVYICRRPNAACTALRWRHSFSEWKSPACVLSFFKSRPSCWK